jgi:hypothetical protein
MVSPFILKQYLLNSTSIPREHKKSVTGGISWSTQNWWWKKKSAPRLEGKRKKKKKEPNSIISGVSWGQNEGYVVVAVSNVCPSSIYGFCLRLLLGVEHN